MWDRCEGLASTEAFWARVYGKKEECWPPGLAAELAIFSSPVIGQLKDRLILCHRSREHSLHHGGEGTETRGCSWQWELLAQLVPILSDSAQ